MVELESEPRHHWNRAGPRRPSGLFSRVCAQVGGEGKEGEGRRADQKLKALSWFGGQIHSPTLPQSNSATSLLWTGVWHSHLFIRVRWQ